jgi:hypothetical protein
MNEGTQKVLYLLNATLSINGEERLAAENFLQQFSNQPGFGFSLTQLTLEPQIPLHLRHVCYCFHLI